MKICLKVNEQQRLALNWMRPWRMELLRLVISITAMSFRWIPYGAGLQVEIRLIYEAYITILRLCLSNKWRRYLQTHTTYYQIEWLNLFDRVYAYLFRFMDFLVSSVNVVRLSDAVLEWERQFKLENNNNYLSKTVSQWGFCQIHAQYVYYTYQSTWIVWISFVTFENSLASLFFSIAFAIIDDFPKGYRNILSSRQKHTGTNRDAK